MGTNPEQERRRLTERYKEIPLEELQEIATDWSELSDLARESLETEIQNRGFTIPDSVKTGSSIPTPDNSPGSKLVMLRQFRDLPEALLAKGSLDSAGIESFLADDNMVRMDWFWSNLIGGVKLMVSPENATEAMAILDQPIPEKFETSDGEYQQPECPQCGSLDVCFEELNKPIAYGSAYISLPLPVHNHGWKCHACGHRWDDPPEEASSN
jgi:hypothetical protein